MKKIFLFVISAITTISSCGANPILSNSESSTTNNVSSTVTEQPTTEESSIDKTTTEETTHDKTTTEETTSPSDKKKQLTFYHKFEKNDFIQSGGEYTINGAKWSISPFAYYGASANGIQIGSSKSPQLKPWIMSTDFGEEVTFLSYSIKVTNAKDGGGKYTFSLDDHEDIGEFNIANSPTLFEHEVNSISTTFALHLSSLVEKAMFLFSLSFTILVDKDSKLDISEDNYIPVAVTPGKNGIPATNYTSTTADEYYKNYDLNLQGTSLVEEIRKKNVLQNNSSYNDAREMLQYTDENEKTPGYIYGMYDGDNIKPLWDGGASWNREHVWACTQMNLTGTARPVGTTKNHTSDLHNLRAACSASNGYHSNKFYDLIDTKDTMFPNLDSEDIGIEHLFKGDHRGDVARILFYMFVTYKGLVLDNELNVNNNLSMGKLSCLLKWNEEDPVDNFEIQRNNRIFEYQGNRNPFIDYSSLANKIFVAK